jgi:tetratricopeptide (TPR) repeat protein
MHTEEELKAAIEAAEQASDPDAVDRAREAYVQLAPDGEGCTEARYRLGLSKLFRLQDIDAALALFKEAAQDKSSPLALEARVSYALCLLNKNKRQQAIFELRKLLPTGVTPSFHTVQALDFLAMLLRESGAQESEIMKIDRQRIEHIEHVAAAAADPTEKAHLWLRLAATHIDGGTRQDFELARARLNDVLKLGAQAGESPLMAARETLKTLPR